MKVFLGWSGDCSYSVARALHAWLPQVAPGAGVWMSSDIIKGKQWSPAIDKQLRETRVGILCITAENIRAPWMLFEAGFLARSADTLICPYLFDVTPGDLPEPLERFQTTMANRNDTERLVLAVNAKAAEATSDRCGASGATCFEDLWPLLERDLRCIDVSNGLKAIQLGQLIDSSATPMYITDERLVLRQCNEPMMSLLRATRRRLIGKTVEEVVEMLAALLIEGEEFRSRQLAMLARARSGLLPDAFFSMDVTLRDLDGSRYVGLHHLYIHADALTSSEESRPLGSFVILHLEKK